MSAGLCQTCAHRRAVPNTRGSVFTLCLRSRSGDPAYPRYPRLPVERCPGYEARPSADLAAAGPGDAGADPGRSAADAG